MRLALLRHGHTSWNRAGRIQGRTDMPLDDAARVHLAQFQLPEPWRAARIVASPLSRAVETAQIVSGHAPDIVPDLIEMDWGQWEGQHGADLKADPDSGYRDLEHWGLDFQPPEGERISELVTRVSDWVDGLSEGTLAVCHIGVMRALIAGPTGWDFTGPPPVRIKRDRLYIIENGALWDEPVRLEKRSSCAF